MPGLVLLLLAGVLLGPDVANIVRPDSLDGGLRVITAAAVALRTGRADVATERIERLGAGTLFGTQLDLDLWSRRVASGEAELHVCSYAGEELSPLQFYRRQNAGGTSSCSSPPSAAAAAHPSPTTRLRADDVVCVLTAGGDPSEPFGRKETLPLT